MLPYFSSRLHLLLSNPPAACFQLPHIKNLKLWKSWWLRGDLDNSCHQVHLTHSGNEETQKQGILKILKIDNTCQKTKIQLENSFSFFTVYNSFFLLSYKLNYFWFLLYFHYHLVKNLKTFWNTISKNLLIIKSKCI